MAGLFDFIKTPEGQGLLGAVAGYAANAQRGAPVNSLGRGGLAGLLAFGKATDNQTEMAQVAKQNELRDMQIAAYKADVAAKNETAARLKAKQAALPTLFRPAGMAGGEAAPQTLGDVPMFSKPMGVTPMQATPGGLDVMGALRAGYDAKEIQELAGLQDVGRPKGTRTMEVDDGNGGKRIALVDDFGREVAGFNGYVAPVQVNQGDKVSFVRPNAGVSLPVGMSPSERDASARGWATVNQGERKLTLDKNNAIAGKAPAGYRWAVDGRSLEPIPGGPAIKSENASEGERKAATLLKRLEGSQKQMNDALQVNPDAAKPELWASGLRAMGAEAVANTITSTQRQQIDAAQLDMLDAALTLGTGAAYTREQLEGYRKSYFPQIGDDQATVKDKQDRLNNVIQAARIAAGRAGGAAPQPASGATGGWSIQKVN